MVCRRVAEESSDNAVSSVSAFDASPLEPV